MLCHVAEVGADIGHRARRARVLGIEAPVPVGVVEQVVLRVLPLHDEDLAQLPVLAHSPHVLHQRVVPQVVVRTVADALLLRELHQLQRVGDRGRERFLAQHVLAGQERILHHLRVKRGGCADVNYLDVRVVEHASVVGLDPLDAVVPSQTIGLIAVRATKARTSTKPNLHSASRCTRPMNPVPRIAAFTLFFMRPPSLSRG